ncbi:hypothetical protein M501DRAFT_1015652 [Patellaria atrata CBS 101060]|uniref:Uncharacterized protein n=1 Tax=Patellaria atrata CBS 101060 TaxID=1346257 RepID=A0A9P4SBE8_9PEZI|nr:hypothetical protein M501DRAFT_1015652 [Patellaria atrata CBS 101060]
MRLQNTLLLALPAVAIAQGQVPLGDRVKGLVDQVQGWVKQAAGIASSAAPSIPKSTDAAAAKVADAIDVPHLTLQNWKSILTPSASGTSSGPEEWMVYVTGGNTTCYGMCGNATAAWNKAVPQLTARPNGPKLAVLDCETDQVLCNCWSAGPPTVWHFLLPQPLPDQSKPATTVRIIGVNRANATASDIVKIHTEKKYLEEEPYEGIFHPFDGTFAQYGLSVPVAYILYAFAKMPNWLPMLVISMFSRKLMSRRMNNQAGAAGAAPAQ